MHNEFSSKDYPRGETNPLIYSPAMEARYTSVHHGFIDDQLLLNTHCTSTSFEGKGELEMLISKDNEITLEWFSLLLISPLF